MLLFTQFRLVDFALSITKLKYKTKKKKYINLRDHQNSAIDIATDTVSPVINGIRIFFPSALRIFSLEIIERKKISRVTANFSALSQLILVFLSHPEVSGNRRKPKRNYITADSHANNFRGLVSFLNI